MLTLPNRVVCADTAAKGVSAGSAESMIGYRRRMCRSAVRGGGGAEESILGFEWREYWVSGRRDMATGGVKM